MSLPETYKVLCAQGYKKEPVIQEIPLSKPGKNQVLVKIEFSPINPSDVASIAGVYPVSAKVPHPVGYEASGTIAAIGEDLKVPHKVGDKVYVLQLGAFGQYVLTNSEDCILIKENISLEQAACHFVNPATVVSFGRIIEKGNHKAVIHTAGASALGKMLIRYLKQKGIKSINIVRKDEYIEDLKKEGADYVLNFQAPDFEERLKEIAQKEEATITFEAICGEWTGKILKCQPDNSTVYVYGAMQSRWIVNLGAPEFIFQGKTVTGFWLMNYMKQLGKIGKEKVTELFEEAHSLLPTIFRSEIQKIYTLEEYKEALAFYSANSAKGKVLFKPN